MFLQHSNLNLTVNKVSATAGWLRHHYSDVTVAVSRDVTLITLRVWKFMRSSIIYQIVECFKFTGNSYRDRRSLFQKIVNFFLYNIIVLIFKRPKKCRIFEILNSFQVTAFTTSYLLQPSIITFTTSGHWIIDDPSLRM